jgi:hypothetical protein
VHGGEVAIVDRRARWWGYDGQTENERTSDDRQQLLYGSRTSHGSPRFPSLPRAPARHLPDNLIHGQRPLPVHPATPSMIIRDRRDHLGANPYGQLSHGHGQDAA